MQYPLITGNNIEAASLFSELAPTYDTLRAALEKQG